MIFFLQLISLSCNFDQCFDPVRIYHNQCEWIICWTQLQLINACVISYFINHCIFYTLCVYVMQQLKWIKIFDKIPPHPSWTPAHPRNQNGMISTGVADPQSLCFLENAFLGKICVFVCFVYEIQNS